MSLVLMEKPAVEDAMTVASFDDLRLRPTTIAALSAMNIETPTPIQAAPGQGSGSTNVSFGVLPVVTNTYSPVTVVTQLDDGARSEAAVYSRS